ncbi:hypothetical protein SeMB42_g04736 [Synchytrium endobioticum]|uniref:Major facilitator superfamily (MFS) profile domain-containing protein n=1 Tax=Synchytrium endobioticum TaxID=286115 RepID=A0A507CWB1_9FUNG|nr:hypothetical protein SeMB42_g04736 [Synchytrium endobioticum]
MSIKAVQIEASNESHTMRQRFIGWYNDTNYHRAEEQIEREKYLFGTLHIKAGPHFNRWVLLPAAMLVQLSVGSLYAWSNYNTPLDSLMFGAATFKANPSLAQGPNVFYVAVGFFGLAAATLGPWLERRGPVKALLVGVTLYMLGHIVAAIGCFTNIYALVFLGYGVISGCGFGLTYISPVSPLQKWFPDHRGLASGFAVAGFGGGTLIASYFITYLINIYGVGYSFLITGFVYAGIMYLCIPFFRIPPPGYAVKSMGVDQIKGSDNVPTATSPLSYNSDNVTMVAIEDEKQVVVSKDLFNRRDLLQLVTSIDYAYMYIMLMGNAITGLLIISRLSNMIQQLFGKPAYEGTTMVAINSLCNMVGRLLFSTVSDYVGRRPMFIFCLTVQIGCIYGILAAAHSGAYGAFIFCVFFAGMCYGAGFGLIPAFLADMFGAKFTGATHGFILTAWSFAGVVGGLVFTAVYNANLVKIPNSTLIDASSYDVDFYWVSAVVILAWLVTVFLLRTDPVARFLPYRKGEWLRSRLFGRLFLLGSFGFKAVSKEDEAAWWAEWVSQAHKGEALGHDERPAYLKPPSKSKNTPQEAEGHDWQEYTPIKTGNFGAIDYRSWMEHAISLVLLRPDLLKHNYAVTKKKRQNPHGTRDDGDVTSDDASAGEEMVMPDSEVLKEYLDQNEISTLEERVFLEETFLGCIRYKKILQNTISVINNISGRVHRAQYEKAVLTVLSYLILFRISELGVGHLAHLSRGFDTRHVASFLSIICDPVTIDTALRHAWCQVLDSAWVEEKLVLPVTQHSTQIQKLSKEFLQRLQCGMTTVKSKKAPTEPKPFILTRPRPRRLPEPTERICTVPKARSIPKSFYEGSGEQAALQKAKATNKAKALTLHQEAQKLQFHAAKMAVAAKKAADELAASQNDMTTSQQKKIVSPARRAPVFRDAAPVKLTTSVILRENALTRKRRDEEIKKMAESEVRLTDHSAFMNWRESARLKEEAEKRIEMERRRLQVQLAHEEAIAARENILTENSKRVQEVKGVKEALARAAEDARLEEDIEKRRKVEQVQDLQENIAKAKQRVVDENLKRAAEVESQSQLLREQAAKQQEEERIRKAELIAQIRLLERNAPPAGSVVKTIDLTETAGAGLLGEMSILELQERVVRAKVKHREEEAAKRHEIMLAKQKKLETVAQQLEEIDAERNLRKSQRENRIRTNNMNDGMSLSRPVSVMSSVSNSTSGSRRTERDALLERDPKLRELADKLAMRRASRLTHRAADTGGSRRKHSWHESDGGEEALNGDGKQQPTASMAELSRNELI